jgi:hypothetical protein
MATPNTWHADDDLGRYRSQIEELLDAVDRLDGFEAATVVRDARRLADDLQSVGLDGPVVDALVAMADALAVGDRLTAADRAADLRAAFLRTAALQPLPDGSSRRQQPFWGR